ncbi:hypothetical protein [Bacillus mycoides]|uniref:hypothetical protein n=1 Tax=Bacillus mycoides TaxID=1405 RepID=UPI003D64E489
MFAIDSLKVATVSTHIIPKLSESDKVDFNTSGMKQKLSALIQRNLRSRINRLLEHNEIIYEKNWVSEFVKKRNSAAHGSYTFEEVDFLIWARMTALLERVLLKEIGYKGEFIDWSESPPIQRKISDLIK